MLPWAEMMRAALMAGIVPEMFWRLSFREWRWLCGPVPEAMPRNVFTALMETYPDKEKIHGRG